MRFGFSFSIAEFVQLITGETKSKVGEKFLKTRNDNEKVL